MTPFQPIRTRLRRWYVPNAIYYIVAVTRRRRPIFADEQNLDVLRQTLRNVKLLHPFRMLAYAFMPDHLHLLMFVPETTNISRLLQSIQWNTTRNYKRERAIAGSVSLWQKSFYDHVIRDEIDLANHFNYIHYNPVKHGLVTEAADYAHTSFCEYLRRGWYGATWGADPSDAPQLTNDGSEPV